MSISLPLVSVLMPAYNSEKYLKNTIESILNQTYQNFEFIIVDDCSTDDSWKIIQTYKKRDTRISCIKNDKNSGMTKTRNKLFDFANKKSKYFAMMDSDDISLKSRLEEQVNFLEKKENKNVGVVGTNLIIIDEDSREIAKREYSEKITKRNVLIKSPVAHPSVMLRKKIIKEVGKYEKRFDESDDFPFLCKIFEFYEIRNIQKKLLKYRIS